jgi:hypothetical protein
MTRARLTPVFALLLALTLFFGGMLSYKLLSGAGVVKAAGGQALAGKPSAQKVGVQGRFAIQVYNASGRLVATWKGHNSLTTYAQNAIAGCLSGITTAPLGFGTCGQTVNAILMCPDSGGFCAEDASTNTMLPAGCDPVAALCTGWQSVATLNILQTSSYSEARGEIHSGTSHRAFDIAAISPSLSLNQGDRAVVTITFTVS